MEDIGADVNVGGGRGSEGGEVKAEDGERMEKVTSNGTGQTPICLAVQSRVKPMVDLLLDLGVSSVHPALKLARELQLDDITGTLLKHVALDRNGDIVNLSGLDLVTVKPQWILPCLGVSESLRRRRSSRQSSDRIKDLLMHRKSIGCIEDKDLEQLRAKMEGLIHETDGPLSGVDGEDETDSPASKAVSGSRLSSPKRGHRRTQSSNASISLTEVKAEQFPGSSHVGATATEALTSPPAALSLSPSPPSPLGMPLQSTPRSSTPLKPRRPGSSSAYRPQLPTISGTPVGSLQRRINHPMFLTSGEEEGGGEGVEHSGEVMNSPTSPPCPNSLGSSGVFVRTEGGGRGRGGTLVVSVDSESSETPLLRTPQRRHHDRLNSLMIQEGARKNTLYLPPSHGVTAGQETASVGELSPSSLAKKMSSVSPAQLLRRLSMWRKTHNARLKKRFSTSFAPFSRPRSPPVRIYTDFTTHSVSGESRDSTPITTDVETTPGNHSRRLSSDEGISTGPAFTSVTNTHNTSTHNAAYTAPGTSAERSFFSPVSDHDSTDGDGGLFNTSTPYGSFSRRVNRQRRVTSRAIRSVSPGQEETEGAQSGATDPPLSPTRLRFSANFRSRVVSEVRERVMSARLVRVLDLSSNSLSGLEDMVGEGGGGEGGRERGEMVLPRLKGLHRLDLKQNRLSRLPYVLMREIRKLSILNLSCNCFERLPSECVLSPALTNLDLSSNKVSSIYSVHALYVVGGARIKLS